MGSQIGEVPAEKVLGAISDLTMKLKKGSISFGELTAFLKRKNPFSEKVAEVTKKPTEGTSVPEINWHDVYGALGLIDEFEAFCATNSKDLGTAPDIWAVPVVMGATLNKTVSAFKKKGVVMYLYVDDLDEAVTDNARDPAKGSYAVRSKKSVEVEKYLGQSANDLKQGEVESITLLERLLLGFGYYLATGKHLDEKTATLCAGSRDRDGSVPRVRWCPSLRRVCVYWYYADRRYDNLGTRVAV